MAQQKNNSQGMVWMFFVGCMILGAGIGALAGNTGTGSVIGMGVGFLLVGVLSYKKK